MILQFPNDQTLLLALTSGVIPPSVAGGGLRAGRDEAGQTWVEPAGDLPKAALASLRKLGVMLHDETEQPLAEEYPAWPLLIAVTKRPRPPEVASTTPVLFDLPNGGLLAELAGEMLRLGNDRQAFRWLTSDEAATNHRALLRVYGPPFYSLLQAIDSPAADGPVAYEEQAPRVWVEFGWQHPLAEAMQPAAGQMLLLRRSEAPTSGGCRWELIDEAPFQDIYGQLNFQLPQQPIGWQTAELAERIRVPLRLTSGGSGEAAELWVLEGAGVDQLDALVRDADQRLLSRLAFAVGEGLTPEAGHRDGPPRVVVRVRPSKQPPPVLVLAGQAYRSYQKVPNLFVPLGRRLHPPLRRDALVKLLVPEADRVTWLQPGEGNEFTPESLPDEAFRPLADWVDYVLDREREPLQAWMGSMQFEFEPYICGSGGSRREADRERKSQPGESSGDPPALVPPVQVTQPQAPKQEEAAAKDQAPLLELTAGAAKPSELQERLRGLEQRFLELEAPADDPQRAELWQEMGHLNVALDHAADATVCWLNALWVQPERSSELKEAWLRTEATAEAPLPPSDEQLDALLAEAKPMPSQVRRLAAYLTWAAERQPERLSDRLGAVQHYLQQHENLLPIRAAWLAWLAVVKLSHGDTLALARARDRLLERLYDQGLSPDQDLPSFLRASGLRTSDRFRRVRDQVLKLRTQAREWVGRLRPGPDSIEAISGTGPYTEGYADLIFAYALARLGETQQARELLDQGHDQLTRPVRTAQTTPEPAVNIWLHRAFAYRTNQALEGRPNTGSLPDDLITELNAMMPAQLMVLYKIQQLQTNSRILQPYERVDHFAPGLASHKDPVSRSLAELPNETDNRRLATMIDALLPPNGTRKLPVDQEAEALQQCLQVAPRLGEAFSARLLARVLPTISLQQLLPLKLLPLEKGLLVAAHFDQRDYVQMFLDSFHSLLTPQAMEAAISDTNIVKYLEAMLAQSFQSLRKLGLRDEIQRLLDNIAALVQQLPSPAKGAGGKTKQKDHETQSLQRRVHQQRLLLHVAAGWFYAGKHEPAMKVLHEARTLLYGSQLDRLDRSTHSLLPQELARAYALALGQAPVEVALPALSEMFKKLRGVSDHFLSMSHYCQSQLNVIESVVLAMVSDDFALDQAGRRWLDDDEYFVRRRVHDDLRQLMSESGG